MNGVSDSVLEALARALQLDEAERAHLFDLARALRPMSWPQRRRAPTRSVRPSIQHVLDGLTGAAAFVHNAGLDNLAANHLGYALYSDMFSRAEFRTRWAAHNVRFHDTGIKDLHHPVVGDITLT